MGNRHAKRSHRASRKLHYRRLHRLGSADHSFGAPAALTNLATPSERSFHQRKVDRALRARCLSLSALGRSLLSGGRESYNFHTVFPPTIVRTALPFRDQPSKGVLREAD